MNVTDCWKEHSSVVHSLQTCNKTYTERKRTHSGLAVVLVHKFPAF